MDKSEKICEKSFDELHDLNRRIKEFNEERDWDQFHTPSNLAKSIAIEAGELLECFQWSDQDFDFNSVQEELADVFNYCLQMAQALDIDIYDAVVHKMEKNAAKYPVDKAKGSAKKYTEL